MSEIVFQHRVIDEAIRLGWKVHWTPDSRKTYPDEPDLRLLRAPRYALAELKTEKGRPTKGQLAYLDEARQCGLEAYLWRPSHWSDILVILV